MGYLARFYGGVYVHQFEKEYARHFNREYGIAVNSGTAALHIAYLGAELPLFSEVLVPANCYISAISALIQCHLIPVVVDIDPTSWVMDPEDIRRKITPRTSAIVPVHMYGQPCPMDEIMEIANEHNLKVIEDCGQSHGALWNGKVTGTFGIAACYSICCRKHVSAGEGGVVISDSKRLSELGHAYTHKGKGEGWFDYFYMGYSYNMTELQAILGIHSLRGLPEELARRQNFAVFVQQQLGGLELEFPVVPENSTHAYFKFNFLVPKRLAKYRNEITDAIRKENLGADPAHPYVLEIPWLQKQEPVLYHLQEVKVRPKYDLNSCPVARDVMARQIGLELGPGLNIDDMEDTVKAVRKVMTWYLKNK